MSLFGKSKADDAALAARYKRLLMVAKSLADERDLAEAAKDLVRALGEDEGAGP